MHTRSKTTVTLCQNSFRELTFLGNPFSFGFSSRPIALPMVRNGVQRRSRRFSKSFISHFFSPTSRSPLPPPVRLRFFFFFYNSQGGFSFFKVIFYTRYVRLCNGTIVQMLVFLLRFGYRKVENGSHGATRREERVWFYYDVCIFFFSVREQLLLAYLLFNTCSKRRFQE